MNHKNILVIDFETGSKSKYKVAQEGLVTQIAACAIHPRKLTIIDTFNTEVRPINMDAVEEEALKITRKTREGLEKATSADIAWRDFSNYVNSHNYKKNEWYAPIAAGYNIRGYDWEILNGYAKRFKDVDDNGQQKLFSNFMILDLMDVVYWWNENSNDLENLQLTTIRKHMGLSTEGAHDALVDVLDTAKIIIKYLQLYRYLGPKVQTKGAFARNG